MLLLGGSGDRTSPRKLPMPCRGIITPISPAKPPFELVSALAACDAVLTNDTGPMHVAAAAGTPVIVPTGSTSPDLTGPGLPDDQILPINCCGPPPIVRRVSFANAPLIFGASKSHRPLLLPLNGCSTNRPELSAARCLARACGYSPREDH